MARLTHALWRALWASLLLAALLSLAPWILGGFAALAGSSGVAGGGGADLDQADEQLAWVTGLGAINHVQGPSDQALVVTAGAARALTLGAASGQNVNVQGGIVMAAGQGALDHLTGPSDQNFVFKGADNQQLRLVPGGTGGDVLILNRAGRAEFQCGFSSLVDLGNTTDNTVFCVNGTGAIAFGETAGGWEADEPGFKASGTQINAQMGDASAASVSVGALVVASTVTSYNNQSTAGVGVPYIVAYGTSTGVDGTTICTYTTGGAVEILEVGGAFVCTAFTSGTMEIELSYTGGTSVRTHDAYGTRIGTNNVNQVGGVGDLKVQTLTIAADASTAVTWKVSRSGTNTATWYAWIKRVN